MRTDASADAKLAELRHLYEPYVFALAERFLLEVADWSPVSDRVDNWRTSAWEKASRGVAPRPGADVHEDHTG
jgi:hypothetical protein